MATRAAIYTRISQDRRGEKAGVARQLADCEQLCAERGWEVVARLEDNDRSAYSGQARPGYDELHRLVEDGAVEIVVAWHPDRLWRSVLEQQMLLVEGRRAALKLVATCTGGEVDPADGDDEFISTLMAAVARKESADKARRIRRRHQEKAERGEFGGGPRAFGYTVDRTEVVAEEAEAIRAGADMLLAGAPLSSIAADWTARGLVGVRGRSITETVVRQVLISGRIAGLRERHGEIVGPAAWPAIIDPATHERVRAMFDARRRRPYAKARRYLLTGILRCSRCGSGMHGQVLNGTARYLCPAPTRGGCSGTVTTVDRCDQAVLDMIATRLDSPAFADAVARAEADHGQADDERAGLERGLAVDRARLDELAVEWADGNLTRDEWRHARDRLHDRVRTSERRLGELTRAAPVLAAPAAGLLVEAWPAMTVDERRAVVLTLVDRIEVRPSRRGVNRFDPGRLVPEWLA